ncbi:MerR family transcriptional regulator [Agaribacter flavus]|uniref:MerR family transcriptional regulator n=1 Tax=Agaribacter flavus TaxID=1902781 RepID=A0ABV7FTE6_9ALTE
MKDHKQKTIGVVAKSANVGIETIRFYERKGILQQPPKIGGFRYYSDEDVRIVCLVKQLQGVGFSLDEVKDFLQFDSCCIESADIIKQKSLNKIEEIRRKIFELQATVNALEKFSNSCGSNKNALSKCDLLDCFENEWECCGGSK